MKHKWSWTKKGAQDAKFFGLQGIRTGVLLSIILLWCVALLSPAMATDFYVSPQGDNNYPGTMEQPWRTITKAANSLQAGHTVYIRQGTYLVSVQKWLFSPNFSLLPQFNPRR